MSQTRIKRHRSASRPRSDGSAKRRRTFYEDASLCSVQNHNENEECTDDENYSEDPKYENDKYPENKPYSDDRKYSEDTEHSIDDKYLEDAEYTDDDKYSEDEEHYSNKYKDKESLEDVKSSVTRTNEFVANSNNKPGHECRKYYGQKRKASVADSREFKVFQSKREKRSSKQRSKASVADSADHKVCHRRKERNSPSQRRNASAANLTDQKVCHCQRGRGRSRQRRNASATNLGDRKVCHYKRETSCPRRYRNASVTNLEDEEVCHCQRESGHPSQNINASAAESGDHKICHSKREIRSPRQKGNTSAADSGDHKICHYKRKGSRPRQKRKAASIANLRDLKIFGYKRDKKSSTSNWNATVVKHHTVLVKRNYTKKASRGPKRRISAANVAARKHRHQYDKVIPKKRMKFNNEMGEMPQRPVCPTTSAKEMPQRPVCPATSVKEMPQRPVCPTTSAKEMPQRPVCPTTSTKEMSQRPSFTSTLALWEEIRDKKEQQYADSGLLFRKEVVKSESFASIPELKGFKCLTIKTSASVYDYRNQGHIWYSRIMRRDRIPFYPPFWRRFILSKPMIECSTSKPMIECSTSKPMIEYSTGLDDYPVYEVFRRSSNISTDSTASPMDEDE